MPAYTGTLSGTSDWECSVIAYSTQSTSVTKSHQVDAVIQVPITKTHQVDAVISKDVTVSHRVDAYITPPVVEPPPGDPSDFSYRTVEYRHTETGNVVYDLAARNVVSDSIYRTCVYNISFVREVTP